MTPEETLKMREMKFNRAFHFVITSEGGTNHDPLDRGGLTNWGISEKQYPDLDIEKLTLTTAKHIYLNDYWLENKCEQLTPDLGAILFDCSVNCGAGSAAKWLQKACNKLGSKLLVDGDIGPKTLFEVFSYSSVTLQNLLIAERLRRYVHMLKKYPEQKRFIRGWIDRVANLIEFTNVSDPTMFEK